jgi:hypothetical protein
MKIEKICGRRRYNALFRVDNNEIACVFDVVGIIAVRFFGVPPAIGTTYALGVYVRADNQPIRARVLRPVSLGTIQAMLKAAGSRRRAKGEWFEIISD